MGDTHKKKSQYKMKIRFVDNEKDVHHLKDSNSRAVFNIMNKNVQTKQICAHDLKIGKEIRQCGN